jgi:cation/acetate symporter
MLQKLDETVKGLGFESYLSSTKTSFDIFCITAALMFGTAGLPHVIIRFFTVPRASDARLSAGWALVFIAVLYTVAPAVGAFARHNIIESVNETTYVPAAGYAQGSQLVSEAGETPSPAWFANWETTGLVAFDDRNGDGQMQIRGPAAPDGLENEVTINNDIYVLANPEIAQLPEWVIGLVVAGGLAAALSTAAGLLMVISSAISHDLCRRTFFKGMTDKTELRVARGSAAAAVIAAGFMGIYSADLAFVAQVVAFAFGLAAASLFPVILLGIFWKRMNREGAIASMLTGLIPTFAYIWHFKLGAGKAATSQDWFLGVSPEGIGFVVMIVSIVVGVAVSLVTKPPPQDIQDLVEDIRIPGSRRSHGIADSGMAPVD